MVDFSTLKREFNTHYLYLIEKITRDPQAREATLNKMDLATDFRNWLLAPGNESHAKILINRFVGEKVIEEAAFRTLFAYKDRLSQKEFHEELPHDLRSYFPFDYNEEQQAFVECKSNFSIDRTLIRAKKIAEDLEVKLSNKHHINSTEVGILFNAYSGMASMSCEHDINEFFLFLASRLLKHRAHGDVAVAILEVFEYIYKTECISDDQFLHLLERQSVQLPAYEELNCHIENTKERYLNKLGQQLIRFRSDKAAINFIKTLKAQSLFAKDVVTELQAQKILVDGRIFSRMYSDREKYDLLLGNGLMNKYAQGTENIIENLICRGVIIGLKQRETIRQHYFLTKYHEKPLKFHPYIKCETKDFTDIEHMVHAENVEKLLAAKKVMMTHIYKTNIERQRMNEPLLAVPKDFSLYMAGATMYCDGEGVHKTFVSERKRKAALQNEGLPPRHKKPKVA